MATSNSFDGQVADKISEFLDYIEKTKSELEEKFGLLYLHGKPRDIDETERQQLMCLAKKLEDIKSPIDQFQKDLFKVCGNDSRSLTHNPEVERRDVKGRLRVPQEPESGYTSRNMSKAFSTPSQSFEGSFTQKADKGDTQATFSTETELYDPSIDPDTNERRTSFYIETPAASTASLNNVDGEADQQQTPILEPLSGQESTTNPTGDEHVPKQSNDLSKPPSEEDNTKYSTESSPTTC